MSLGPVDITVILFYFVIILFVGFYASKRKNQKSANQYEEFLLAGRRLSLPMFVATLVATWYGNILGVGEFVYNNGFNAWICFGLPYYIAAILYAIFIAGKVRSSGTSSIPEQITGKYGRTAGQVANLVVLLITIPASYVLMLGVMINLISGLELWISILAGTFISIIILFKGGFKADVMANSVQFILMYAGFIILLLFSYLTLGNPFNGPKEIPPAHLTILGNNSWQYVLSWYIIAFQTFIDPGFHQRCAASLSPEKARKGVLISVLFWILFDFLTLACGFYAYAFTNPESAMMGYPALGELVLPAFFKGMFIVSLLATIMSTLDSYAFISAISFGKEILEPVLRFLRVRKIPDSIILIRFGIVLTSLSSVIIAYFVPSAIDIIYKTASVAVPGLLIPLIVSYSEKYYFGKGAAISMIFVPSFVSGYLTFVKHFDLLNLIPIFLKDFEPMLPGILLSLLMCVLLLRKQSRINVESA